MTRSDGHPPGAAPVPAAADRARQSGAAPRQEGAADLRQEGSADLRQEGGEGDAAPGDADASLPSRLTQSAAVNRLLHQAGCSAGWCRQTYRRSNDNVAAFIKSREPAMWLIALLVGAAVGGAAVLFRVGISAVQWLWLGTTSESIIDAVKALPWWAVVAAPTAGGLLVGLLNQYVLTGRRPAAVADVMEASARGGAGLGWRQGIYSALATVISLGSGASAGREGPVVHLGGTLASALTRAIALPPKGARVVLACGVASAISASFNAPIAGVLFAHEVVLRHYAISAFVPIVIASVAGTLAGRYFIGDVAAFDIPAYTIGSYWEVPAFALLGVCAAGVAILFQFALIVFDQSARAVVMPTWLRPVIGGVVIGFIGVYVPEILGVGYDATDTALRGGFAFGMLLLLLFTKIFATALTLASRFGGGIFSPSLYLGAMTGGAFGIVAASVFPEYASAHGLYAILGMGAVTSALLGAPISTTVIVFELTGGYTLSIALLLTVSIATGLHLAVHGRSFFHYQLETRGVVLADGPHRYFLKTVRVASFMTPTEEQEPLEEGAEETVLRSADSLEAALRVFNETGVDVLKVVDQRDRRLVVGTVNHVQALRAYNRRLVEASEEQHR